MNIAIFVIVGLFLLILIMFGVMGRASRRGKTPGLVDGRLSDCVDLPNNVSSEESAPDAKKVEPLRAATLADIRKAILALGGNVVQEDPGYLAAEFVSRTFRFVDDVEVRDAGAGLYHIRSASRVGYSDRGINRRRVEAIRSKIPQPANR